MDKESQEREYHLPLYDRLGGRVFIELITGKFCDRLLSDDKIKDKTDAVPREDLEKHIAEIAANLFGAEETAAGRFLDEIRVKVNLTQSQFNLGISHLIAAFVWAGVSRQLIEEAVDAVTPLAEKLVNQ